MSRDGPKRRWQFSKKVCKLKIEMHSYSTNTLDGLGMQTFDKTCKDCALEVLVSSERSYDIAELNLVGIRFPQLGGPKRGCAERFRPGGGASKS